MTFSSVFASFYCKITIASTLVSRKPDYYNSLFQNISFKDITKLQRVKYCLANVVPRSPRFARYMPFLMCRLCVPVRYRIIVNVCNITY